MIDTKLLRAIPRPVRLTLDGAIVNCLAFALLIGSVVGATWFYVRARRDAGINSVTTPGRVVLIDVLGGRESRAIVTYEFEMQGQVRRGSDRLSRLALRGIEPDSVIAVHYDVSNPGRTWLNRPTPNPTPIWVAPLFFVSLAAPAGMMFWQIRRQRSMLSAQEPQARVRLPAPLEQPP